MRLDLSSIEEYVTSHLKMFIFSVLGLLVLLGVIAITVFFIHLRGAEQIMVPNVQGKELTQALLELQVKELYPRIQLRFSQNAADRGLILEQDPRPGTIVRAGRRIRLVVSQGIIVNRIENFVGRNIEDVRMDFLTVFVSPGGLPLLIMQEPLMFEFSPEPPGTILAQRPEAGTDISGATTMEFIVSRGREHTSVTIPQLTGLELSRVLELISSTGINFQFNTVQRSEAERGQTIVSQHPPAHSTVPSSTVVQLTVTTPEFLEPDEVFGLFRYTIPPNPFPLPVRLDAILPAGERIRLFTVEYPGGEFTVPYRLPVGSTLVLTMMNRELHREAVR